VTAIWHRDNELGWRLLAPTGFPDEAVLHTLVEQAPQLLPLAGSPRLTVLGREVRLGASRADLIAVEQSGRLAVIEIKLASNAEARRAVVAQVLAYAAQLFRLSVEQLEQDVLGHHLADKGVAEVADRVADEDQAGAFDRVSFRSGLTESLSTGMFRLVFVLDEAPEELVKLVGYLTTVTPELVIDLITVSQFRVGEDVVLVPQRVDPERHEPREAAVPVSRVHPQSEQSDGVEAYEAICEAAGQHVLALHRPVIEWARNLHTEGLARVFTIQGGTGALTIWCGALNTDASISTVYYYGERGPLIRVWRSVIERAAPRSLPHLGAIVHPDVIGKGTVLTITDALLEALTDAYREAAGR
jgi:hypothetical protein